ncbi:MAG: creatininase family protein [Candidatus Micrarchaeota archaeon]|nr:creatininase family protein [Candidatus Micrarchaeota archaeon]
MARTVLFEELTSKEIELIAKKKNRPVVILPMGATEAHGPHLPVGTDSITPYELAKKVASQSNALVLPPINYGFCYTLRPWAGTLSLKSSTFASLIKDIAEELVRNKFDKILLLNGHGGNAAVASQALKELADRLQFRCCIVSWWEIPSLKDITGESVGHADENEASLLIALTGWEPRKVPQQKTKKFFGRVIPTPPGVFTKFGYIGKVGGSSLQKGQAMQKLIVKKLVDLINADLLLEEQ